MKWSSEDASDYRVQDQSGWKDLDNYTDLKTNAGVYIFANVDLQVKYIGKAGPGRMVLEIADAVNREKNKGASKVKALYTNSDENALSLEKKLIDKYDPPNNKT